MNTVITQFGLDYVLSAHDAGPLVAVKYFVPVYDYRIDSLIHDSTIPVSAFSAVSDPSRATPFGEIIWNTAGSADYALTDINTTHLVSGTDTASTDLGGGHHLISYPVQSQKWQINKHLEVPLSDHFVGTSATYNSSNLTWDIWSGYTVSAGTNTPPATLKDGLFEVIDYYPVSGDGGIKGVFKCRLIKPIGDVKFNKIALYAVRYDGGVETAEDPIYFAETFLKTTVVKTSLGNSGFDDITVDVQVDLKSISATWDDIYYSTSGDYWSRVPGGLYYSEKIGVGSFREGIDEPQASIHARYTEIMQDQGLSAYPQLRLDYNDDKYMETVVTSAGETQLVYKNETFVNTLIWSNIFSGVADSTKDAITPVYPTNLGYYEKRFGAAYIRDELNISNDLNSPDNYFRIYRTSRLGDTPAKYVIEGSDDIQMSFIEKAINIPTQSEWSYIEGADIRKQDRSLAMYTTYSDTNSDIAIIGGVYTSAFDDASFQPLADTSQYGLTHKNLMYKVNPDVFPTVDWIDGNSRVFIFGRKLIDTKGPLQLDVATQFDNEGTLEFYNYGAIFSRKTETVIVTGLLNSYTLPDVLAVVREEGEEDVLDDYLSFPDNAIKLIGNVRTSYVIAPLMDSRSKVGYESNIGIPDLNGAIYSERKFYNRLFVDTIGAYSGEAYDTGTVYLDNRVQHIYAADINTTSLETESIIAGASTFTGIVRFQNGTTPSPATVISSQYVNTGVIYATTIQTTYLTAITATITTLTATNINNWGIWTRISADTSGVVDYILMACDDGGTLLQPTEQAIYYTIVGNTVFLSIICTLPISAPSYTDTLILTFNTIDGINLAPKTTGVFCGSGFSRGLEPGYAVQSCRPIYAITALNNSIRIKPAVLCRNGVSAKVPYWNGASYEPVNEHIFSTHDIEILLCYDKL